jgi:hypothetical protein
MRHALMGAARLSASRAARRDLVQVVRRRNRQLIGEAKRLRPVPSVALVLAPVHCEHYICRCARAAELAAMGLLPEAIRVHQERVRCRQPQGNAGES